MVENWKEKTKSYEEYDKIMRESAKEAPETDKELEDALKEFECEWNKMSEQEKEELKQMDKKAYALARGDYSSLDLELQKIFEKKNKKKKDKPPEASL
ncbi:MAG: hypothetical protein HYS98_07105 [Deltaproteobacteria bacterium]|nr:hypothetical protein [Deltaproteobacteria bacterium]